MLLLIGQTTAVSSGEIGIVTINITSLPKQSSIKAYNSKHTVTAVTSCATAFLFTILGSSPPDLQQCFITPNQDVQTCHCFVQSKMSKPKTKKQSSTVSASSLSPGLCLIVHSDFLNLWLPALGWKCRT